MEDIWLDMEDNCLDSSTNLFIFITASSAEMLKFLKYSVESASLNVSFVRRPCSARSRRVLPNSLTASFSEVKESAHASSKDKMGFSKFDVEL